MRLLYMVAVLIGFAVTARASVLPRHAFTYQGALSDAGAAANGTYDLRFTFYPEAFGGSPAGASVCADNVQVNAGVFTVVVPLFSPASGEAWLNVEFRKDTGLGCSDNSGWTAVQPRQRLQPTPQAVYALALAQDVPTIPGAVRFNAATRTFEGFDGQWWREFTTSDPILPENVFVTSSVVQTNFTVPDGVTTLFVELWGGGGGGGHAGTAAFASSVDCGTLSLRAGGGGGGGSGAFIRASLEVTPGETLTLFAGVFGLPGLSRGSAGGDGGVTSIRRGNTVLLAAPGGKGGGGGTNKVPASANSCGLLPEASAGGAGGAAGTLSAPGKVLFTAEGNVGQAGRGPRYTTGPCTSDTCAGDGGVEVFNGLMLDLPPTRGAGGDGSKSAATPMSGQNGGIRLSWY
ncbi:MAG TPA: hypothetical protein VF777_09425 [Phycisphaerales bacterium]